MKKISLDQFKVKIEIPVQWGSMDAARHVNNLVYMRWGESSRIRYFEEIGADTSFTGDCSPILAWQDCKYIFPMTFPDTAIIGVKTLEIQADRFMMQSAVFSKKHQRIAALSHQTIVAYDYVGLKKTDLPDNWVKKIIAIEEDGLIYS